MNVSDEERARNRAEHAAKDSQRPPTQAVQGWSTAAKALLVLIVGLFGYVAWAMATQGGLTRAPLPARTLPYSALLGMAVPESYSFVGESAQEAVEAAQDTARELGLACTTSYELFGVSDEMKTFDAINTKMQADGYVRTNLMDAGEVTAFKAVGPKHLFGLMHPMALYLCEY